MCGPNLEAAGDPRLCDMDRWLRAQRRWLGALWVCVVALNVTLLVVFVASLDPALIPLAGGLVANLIVVTQGWNARRSLAGHGQPRR